ncbi:MULTISPECIES: hypothetical protein [unclassified Leucobacter]|uniref:hypothetical protein n=1 Tax=unclassified Leucobacter TaxID=2621730 RepID=UPI000621ADF7|nr:hypothetical protein [Leucobacter sp. Ag1]KKI22074.1 hypothetical protein XM48_03125 [Leucobacter sp. Ag1]
MSNTAIAPTPAAQSVAAPDRHEALSAVSFLVAFLGLWLVAIPLGHVAGGRARKRGASTALRSSSATSALPSPSS